MLFSNEYVELLSKGAFTGQIDPWAEAPHYFQQIHASMIGNIAGEIQTPLMKMGYYVGREASLQIAENREPDIFIQRAMNAPQIKPKWDYELAAAEVLADPGLPIEAEVTLDALHIHKNDGTLVTVVEIISPSNKMSNESIADYRQRRERLVIEQGVNVVEIDPTRSIKRLVFHRRAAKHPYHVMVYIPNESPHFIEMEFRQAMKRVAFPLRGEVIPVELQNNYDRAYQQVAAAAQILNDNFYTEANLPFPSLLSDTKIREATESVSRWREGLKRLQTNSGYA